MQRCSALKFHQYGQKRPLVGNALVAQPLTCILCLVLVLVRLQQPVHHRGWLLVKIPE